MGHSIKDGNVLIRIFAFLFLFFTFSCSHSSESPTEDRAFKAGGNEPPTFKKPRGDELRIITDQQSGKKFRIQVTNVSEEDVLLPYEPGKGTRVAGYFAYGTERREIGGDDFNLLDTWGHFAPRLRALAPTESLEFFFEREEPGEYRLLFRYANDPLLASGLAENTSIEKDTAVLEKFISAYFEIRTPILVVN